MIVMIPDWDRLGHSIVLVITLKVFNMFLIFVNHIRSNDLQFHQLIKQHEGVDLGIGVVNHSVYVVSQ